jgi:hypothetical protein
VAKRPLQQGAFAKRVPEDGLQLDVVGHEA